MRVPVSGGAVESGVRPEESNPWGRSCMIAAGEGWRKLKRAGPET